jgi:hypothetical protein
MEGHPESSISSKNQQFEPPQLVAQPWAPIHNSKLGSGFGQLFKANPGAETAMAA